MKMKALVNFSYQNRSFKNGQEFEAEDPKMEEVLLKSGHVEQIAVKPSKAK